VWQMQVCSAMYQRSRIFFLGCPFNIASLNALLDVKNGSRRLLWVEPAIHLTGMGGAALYANHMEQPSLQLNPRAVIAMRAQMHLNPEEGLFAVHLEDFTLEAIRPTRTSRAPVPYELRLFNTGALIAAHGLQPCIGREQPVAWQFAGETSNTFAA